MAKRSPILGFNHNIKHRGIVFHVQTEDSGVDNPHLYTHLFHGGVILKTKKLEYSSDSAVDVVKSLMQAQHKSVLKELKSGQHDDKIDEYMGKHPDLLPRGATEPRVPSEDVESEISGAFDRLVDRDSARVHSPPPPSAPEPPGLQMSEQGETQGAGKGRRNRFARRTSQPPPFRDGAESSGVIVSRPAVIVGTSGNAAASAREQRARVDTARESLFGEEIISEKSLDDVILAYLREDTNDE